MFQHTMTSEARDGIVEILDYSYGAVKCLLGLVYTGRSENLHDHAQELLVISEKYDVAKVKSLCERKLIATLPLLMFVSF